MSLLLSFGFPSVEDLVELVLDPVHDPNVVLPRHIDQWEVCLQVVEVLVQCLDVLGVPLVRLLKTGCLLYPSDAADD